MIRGILLTRKNAKIEILLAENSSAEEIPSNSLDNTQLFLYIKKCL